MDAVAAGGSSGPPGAAAARRPAAGAAPVRHGAATGLPNRAADPSGSSPCCIAGTRLTLIKSRSSAWFHHARDVSQRPHVTVNITGIVVYPKPGRVDDVRAALAAIGGVEVHAVSPEGRMVVTVERPDDSAATGALDTIARTDGVLSTALVYHHDEALNEESTNR